MTLDMLVIFIASSIRLSIPLLFAATGEYASERAGIVNMSVEGMMLMGAFGGAAGSHLTGSAEMGLLIAVVAVLPVALLQALLTNVLRANQVVTGLGINILVLGCTTLGYRALFGARSRELIDGFDALSPPLLGDLPVVGPVFQQAGLAYFAVAVIALVIVVITRTGIGAALKATGEDPHAALISGVPVPAIRNGAVIFTGIMAGLGGAFMSLADIHTFTEGMTRGAGYLAIVAVIFGNWRIGRVIVACLLFGAATALQFQLPALGVELPNALLIMLPYLLAFAAVAGLAGRQTAPRGLARPFWG